MKFYGVQDGSGVCQWTDKHEGYQWSFTLLCASCSCLPNYLSNYRPLFVQSNPGFRACLLLNLWWKLHSSPAAPFQVFECVCSLAWGCPLASPYTAFSLLLSPQSAFVIPPEAKQRPGKLRCPAPLLLLACVAAILIQEVFSSLADWSVLLVLFS